MHFELKKMMIAWSVYCNTLSMTHTRGTIMRTWKSLHCCFDCSSGTLNYLVSLFRGTVESKHIIMSEGYGLPERFWGPGHKNVKHHSVVESSRILLLPLLIWLGIMKCFVKAMDRNDTAFLYLRQKFPLFRGAKLREGVFSGPDISSLLRD
jgi:hypothetical protein